LDALREENRTVEEITGSASLTQESQSIAPVTTVKAFFGVAESLIPGMQLLIETPPSPAIPITFLAGHILECLLKAFLSKEGVSEKDLKDPKKFGHDLSKLWQEAVKQTLLASSVLPPWADRLSALHGSPYPLRYNTGRAHGLTSPNSQELLSELTDLLEKVRQEIRK
jgi:hypothetical protein